MKFYKHISAELQELLETQYKEYIKSTPMTRKEQRALCEWVKNGNSVFENPDGAWYDGQAPVEFLTVYRDDEYIRQHTKGMSSEAARRFAMAYYGWEDEPTTAEIPNVEIKNRWSISGATEEDLPFN